MTTAEGFPYPRALRDFPRLRQSLLGDFMSCQLMTRFKQDHEQGWSTKPQARGSFVHRWFARLLQHLEATGRDALVDEPECPKCKARPNEGLIEGEQPFQEGNACPGCGTPLIVVPLTEVALDLLCDVLRQHDVPDEDLLPMPGGEHLKDMEWVVMKAARDQRFKIANLVSVEERLEAEVPYALPGGGHTTRTVTGQLDCLFVEEYQEGLRAIVPDWKDTWDIPGPSTISTDGFWQQRLYALLVLLNYPAVDWVTLRETYVRAKAGESGTDNLREATIHRSKLPLLIQEVSAVCENFDRAWDAYMGFQEAQTEEERKRWRVRMAAAWTPTPGGHCNYCPLPEHCPILPDVRRHGAVRTPDEAREVAGRLVIAKRIAKTHETMLKDYLSTPGPRPTAEVTKPIGTKDAGDKLMEYKDKRPGLPEGVPVKHAKGRRVFAFVEGTRRSSPSAEQIQEALAAAARGVPVDAESLYKTGTSTTLRLVEEAVPVDDAPSEKVVEAINDGLARLEAARGGV